LRFDAAAAEAAAVESAAAVGGSDLACGLPLSSATTCKLRALGIEVPSGVLSIADEVIE